MKLKAQFKFLRFFQQKYFVLIFSFVFERIEMIRNKHENAWYKKKDSKFSDLQSHWTICVHLSECNVRKLEASIYIQKIPITNIVGMWLRKTLDLDEYFGWPYQFVLRFITVYQNTSGFVLVVLKRWTAGSCCMRVRTPIALLLSLSDEYPLEKVCTPFILPTKG